MYDNSFEGQVYNNSLEVAGIAGTGEQTLKSFSLPANSLCQGSQSLRIRARLLHAANTHAVTFKLYFGSESVSSGSLTTSGETCTLTMDITKTGSKTQMVWADGNAGGTGLGAALTRATEDDTAPIIIKTTVTGTTTGADGADESLMVEFLQSV